MDAPWLSQLTLLETELGASFTTTARKTLDILAGMPRLQSLTLGHSIQADFDSMDAISTYPIVNLSNLTYMAISSDDITCLAFVEKIRRSPSGCLVNFNSKITTSGSFPTANTIIFSLFNRLLAENIRIIDLSGSISWICLNIQQSSVAIASHGCRNYRKGLKIVHYPKMSSHGLFMGFHANALDVHLSLVPVINSLFTATPLQGASTIRLIWEGRYLSAYYACLPDWTSVKTLEASIETIKSLYLFGTPRNPPSPLILPNLSKIRLYSEMEVYHRTPMLRDFLFRRSSSINNLVERLEILRTANIYGMAEELSRVPGLQEIISYDRDGHRVCLDMTDYSVGPNLVEV